MNAIGTALYVAASVFDHSCVPNAAPVFVGNRITVRAMKHVKDGEKVVINYVDLKMPYGKRREALRSQYYFDCDCIRCLYEKTDQINLAGASGGDHGQERSWPNDATLERAKDLDKEFDDIVDSTGNKNWLHVFKLGCDAYRIYKKVYEEYHPDLTIQLFRIAKVLR